MPVIHDAPSTTYANESGGLVLHADVLVIGGGPAATWAALSAARSGAKVVLADKGYCGTSGATAPSNTGAWYLPAGAARDAEVNKRLEKSAGLADRRWIIRTMEEALRGLDELGGDGYPFPFDEDGRPYRANLRGPDYMHHQRRRVKRAGVTILDHHPALELLWADGVVAGAAGVELRSGERWQVRAGAVVIAAGGCTFLSRALGCDGNTGDSYLLAAEAGARLSGMEFSAQYGLSAEHATVTKGLTFTFASFYLEDGSPLPSEGGDRSTRIARAMIAGHKVYALMNKGEAHEHDWLVRGQPNCFLPFERIGIDPFKERFPVTLRSEGTVRGTGGLDVVSDDCASNVPGLYVAGDAASREKLVGAISGGGSPNASWAIASGVWSGRGAAQFAARQAGALGDRLHTRDVRALGGAGIRPNKQPASINFTRELIAAVQDETLPLDVNFFRTGERIALSRAQLDGIWAAARDHLGGSGRELVRAREAASMAATARLIWASAAARDESRGLHRRVDRDGSDPAQTQHIHSRGVDDLHVTNAPTPHTARDLPEEALIS
ncbi:FAD-binding protein [Uliginosibacterium sp. H1]|uniref:FAD-binding protein n=1 Tax=Uliginosibacterium sp. H1 TaxID=3114757 RepID=UPI002E19DCE6|nr:FAD-binding protein [Uliginosibacterium sp. H1]